MKCTPETRWKYLRENDKKFFDLKRNTTLKEYLEAIFPKNTFLYSYTLKKFELPDNVEYHRYECDAICKDLGLVVEFDGVNHYMDTQVCINDMKKDYWLSNLGYKVVRIPYWIQLSSEVIEDLFQIELDKSAKFCELDYSFYYPETDTINFNILPGNMCELGRNRFVREFNKFRKSIQIQILNDLFECCSYVDKYSKSEFLSSVVPCEVYRKLGITFFQNETEEQILESIENILFDEHFNMFMYPQGVRTFFNLHLDDAKKLRKIKEPLELELSKNIDALIAFLENHETYTLWGCNLFQPSTRMGYLYSGFEIPGELSELESKEIEKFMNSLGLKYSVEVEDYITYIQVEV